MSDWIEKVQEELNNERPGQVHYLGSMEDVKSLPQTVCLVYMTENHDGGQADYCEVYKDEKTARAALSKAGFHWMKDRHPEVLLNQSKFSSYPDTATIVPEVRIKTDE